MKKLRKLETSYRIMKVLKLLHQKPLRLDELCYELDASELGVNKETITKYFSTLREVGCVIEKSEGKFWLKHLPFFVDFNKRELETLAIFQKFAQKLHQKKLNEKLQSALSKILKMTDVSVHINYHQILNSIKFEDIYYKNKEKLELLSNFFDENAQKLKIKYRSENYKILPKCFKFNKINAYLFAFNEESKKYQNFLLDDIEEIVSLIQNTSAQNFASVTVFKITDRLASGYTLYENELIHEIERGVKIVTNKTQDKKELHSRLLKYGEFCEIISPKDEKEIFKRELDEMIKNYSY